MPVSLAELTNAAQALLDADKEVKRIDGELKKAKENARVLREETIPGALQELGVTSIQLDTGQKITITQTVYASIPDDKKIEAFKWLNENGFGGLIKTLVKREFGKGERTDALNYAAELVKNGHNVKFEESVHPQTLKAFINEQIKNAKSIPLDLFGARPVVIAKIK